MLIVFFPPGSMTEFRFTTKLMKACEAEAFAMFKTYMPSHTSFPPLYHVLLDRSGLYVGAVEYGAMERVDWYEREGIIPSGMLPYHEAIRPERKVRTDPSLRDALVFLNQVELDAVAREECSVQNSNNKNISPFSP